MPHVGYKYDQMEGSPKVSHLADFQKFPRISPQSLRIPLRSYNKLPNTPSLKHQAAQLNPCSL
ncbi:hypothetical protein Halhy_6705 (plasmid) [Haliscomenobacter hydrossis DSM 1100]|uniref:Uncharacterized protein n=1 Tax=Haliscomenobacter hydrossis (strain ATCC 27775 / DSM 1100 / LMG 10767 / O) TaxID=760192 RepID=F4L812_HALH1|nr:hypothetical protein Halhy_6705 [Haliscomenobacter hydrossis DSM 1100]